MKARILGCILWAALPAAALAQTAYAPAAPAHNEAGDAAPAARTLTLAQALAAARKNQPSLRQARASTATFRARYDIAGAPLLPQVTGTAGYGLASKNIPNTPGTTYTFGTTSFMGPPSPDKSFKPYSAFNFGVSASQLVYDFGQAGGRHDAAGALVKQQEENEHTSMLDMVQSVRASYFSARAAKALWGVATETLANYERHLAQIEAFVQAGTRAEIDLAQVRTDRANATVDLIKAENAYASAKAQLNQAMGVEQGTDYEVVDESMPPVDGEDGALEALLQRALDARPEFIAIRNQLRAQQLTLGAIRGAYWPSLGVGAGLTDTGKDLTNLAWNWNVGATLTWQIYQGGLTDAQVAEARANLMGFDAQVDALRQRVRLEVEQARLAVRAAKALLVATEEAATNARERLRLANARYDTGVGSGLELGDAQLALTSALARRVQADYDQATARAQLLRALGQM